ncbi:Late embryogenesis abundant protein [Macleaya cordata]|uniref:Late embryogenesis abundant protein n=1 Tax=Macleaya cordata TaxID=56857 RepID=A0A200PUK7_MACCD|nr:Late embryogenesis abundant protein [Macleaya cordata]
MLLAVAGSLFYVWFQPKLPSFHIQSVKTPIFNVTVTPDGTFLDAQTDVKFEATNPNTKIDFYFGQTQVRMTVEDDVDIGSATIPEFTQGRKNTTILKFETNVKKLLIDDESGRRLKDRIRSKMMVVNVEVRTRVGVGLEKWKLGKMAVVVMCEDVRVKQVEGGDTPKCAINLFKW